MSSVPLSTIGSVVTGQLQQMRGADTERGSQEVTNHGRRAEAAQRAESAAGVETMEQDGAASERDADGRRLWERSQSRSSQPPADTTDEPELRPSKDPLGASGNQLDLSG